MIELLPKSVSEFPIFFEDEELKYLDGSPLQEYVEETRASIQMVYEKICQLVPDFQIFDFSEYCETMILI